MDTNNTSKELFELLAREVRDLRSTMNAELRDMRTAHQRMCNRLLLLCGVVAVVAPKIGAVILGLR